MLQDKADVIKEVIEKDIWGSVQKFLNWGIHFGEGEQAINITVGFLLVLTVTFIVARFLLKWLRRLLTRKMIQDDKLKFISVFKFINYLVYIIVILITISATGIDITILITASAALFVGLGLALQEIFQDVIGGILIIIDKSLNVGDIIDVDGKVGKVYEIKLRTSRALTRDDKVMVIPNHKFITDIIYNITQNHKRTRESIQVGVAYSSDIQLVTQVLLDVAISHANVLKKPTPFVLFEDFGDSALQFTLNFYLNDSYNDPFIKSDLRYSIHEVFGKEGITIPFPQRDVHLFQSKGIKA